MRWRTGFSVVVGFSLMACVKQKLPATVPQQTTASGITVAADAAKELEISEELIGKVYSRENLLKAQAQLTQGKNFELNVLMRSDWQSRLPMRLRNGLLRKYEDIDQLEDVVGLGDLPIRKITTMLTRADSLRRMSVQKKAPVFELMKIEMTKNSLPELIQALNTIHRLPAVMLAEPNFKVRKIATPNDPSFPSLWGMTKISAPSAWDSFTGNDKVVVAVLDTGVDIKHKDLKDNIWTNTKEIAANGIDDDGNGYIDDVHGWDFAYGDNDPSDADGHGTHCSGTIAARGNNALGIAGVNWVSRIMPVKILDDQGSGYTFDIYSGLIYAVSNGARVTSNSYGGGGASSLMASAIKTTQDAGVLFVAAAGNESASSASYPAFYTKTYTNVISVASTESNDSLSWFSNYGDGVDVAAPGGQILSTAPSDQYATFSGTSMATPHVAGLAAFLWAAAPSKTLAQIRAAIVDRADYLSQLQGKVAANGRINMKKSFDFIGGVETPAPTPTASPTVTPSPTPTASPTVTPSPTPTASPTVTPSPAPTPNPTSGPTPTPTPTPAPTATPAPTPTATPTPTPVPGFSNGFQYRIYRGFWTRIPNFDRMTPSGSGVASAVSLAPSGRANQFGVVFEGQLWVPVTGSYTFFLKSDDGSILKINGNKVIDNDGLHKLRERSATVQLNQGFHSVRVDYFQLFGASGLSMQWQGPSFTRRKFEGKGVLYHIPKQ